MQAHAQLISGKSVTFYFAFFMIVFIFFYVLLFLSFFIQLFSTRYVIGDSKSTREVPTKAYEVIQSAVAAANKDKFPDMKLIFYTGHTLQVLSCTFLFCFVLC